MLNLGLIIPRNNWSLTFSKTLSGVEDVQHEGQTEDKMLDQAEMVLGDHVTGGVVQSWRQVQRRLGDVLAEGKHPGWTIFQAMLWCIYQ